MLISGLISGLNFSYRGLPDLPGPAVVSIYRHNSRYSGHQDHATHPQLYLSHNIDQLHLVNPPVTMTRVDPAVVGRVQQLGLDNLPEAGVGQNQFGQASINRHHLVVSRRHLERFLEPVLSDQLYEQPSVGVEAAVVEPGEGEADPQLVGAKRLVGQRAKVEFPSAADVVAQAAALSRLAAKTVARLKVLVTLTRKGREPARGREGLCEEMVGALVVAEVSLFVVEVVVESSDDVVLAARLGGPPVRVEVNMPYGLPATETTDHGRVSVGVDDVHEGGICLVQPIFRILSLKKRSRRIKSRDPGHVGDVFTDKPGHVSSQREADDVCSLSYRTERVSNVPKQEGDHFSDQPGVGTGLDIVGIHGPGPPVDTDNVDILQPEEGQPHVHHPPARAAGREPVDDDLGVAAGPEVTVGDGGHVVVGDGLVAVLVTAGVEEKLDVDLSWGRRVCAKVTGIREAAEILVTQRLVAVSISLVFPIIRYRLGLSRWPG